MNRVQDILKSLVPQDQEDLSVLRRLLHHAQRMACGLPHQELGDLMDAIPQEARKYFHGLVEAVEIYQSIRGESLTVQTLTMADPSVYELKQIRDMCLEGGLRSIY